MWSLTFKIRGTGTPMSEVIEDNKEEWGMNE